MMLYNHKILNTGTLANIDTVNITLHSILKLSQEKFQHTNFGLFENLKLKFFC